MYKVSTRAIFGPQEIEEVFSTIRILHFCRGRIAWECTEFEDIEGTVPGIPSIKLIGGEIRESVPTKGLDVLHGDQLRRERLRVKHYNINLVSETPEDYRLVCALELWARAVEMYSKTDLTMGGDKLIALSGIASQMATIIGSASQPAEYVAGLWKPRLVGQLLWKIEPVFRGSECEAGAFDYPSTRSEKYRAPSFSWASIDAQHGNGITYGEPLGPEDRVLVEIPPEADRNKIKRDVDKSVWVDTSTTNKYGLIRGGHLLLWGWLRRVKLQRDGVFYSWYLQGRNRPGEKDASGRDHGERIDTEQHLNVLMDCPGDDNENDKLIHSAKVYCLPVAFGPPTAAPQSKDLTCLLLEQVSLSSEVESQAGWHQDYRGAFRRVGLTKLTPSFDSVAMMYILDKLDDDQHIIPTSHTEGYDDQTGKHLIRLI
ncbi:hypothetical protein N0V93_007374 [Gnomoniopsis smithogilvyi]|uniref:Heterokaryon incompatibility domain-containing protein n=1 Tax=Gnomoniopsis smithogilvyi TaxID=1191159 RepID=A0A9W9CWL2_9PEZI|nr:hypothetical protein N0V93_007374 [Gnomoniopsis smithogilvyi]